MAIDMAGPSSISRRDFMASASLVGAAGTAFPLALREEMGESDVITVEMIAGAEKIAGLSFSPEERAAMLEDLEGQLGVLEELHEQSPPNSVIPALVFDPQLGGERPRPRGSGSRPTWEPSVSSLPASDRELAFAPVSQLAYLLKSRKIKSVRLTSLYLARLKEYGPVLECVITLTEERAMAQARAADEELDAGRWRGPLHGVPWGAKDLLAVEGYKTTWGAEPFKDQSFDYDAAVVRKLDEAGAVLVAKLTLGALAWGDVWFGGKTRNPWNIEQGSSGSSAGPGAAVAAGLVGFAIGSETLGSIVSPSTRNGVAGLRPTFGRVSRAGAMTLCWSLDKLGPMCRSAEDCALVFSQIQGEEDGDPTTVDSGFEWPGQADPEAVRIGYIESAFEGSFQGAFADRAVLEVLRSVGYDPQPMEWPARDTGGMMLALAAESAAAFDQLTRSGGVDSMVSQQRWPKTFKQARFISAVDYINGQRQRTLLMKEMAGVFEQYDVVVTNYRGNGLRITNLTGHPSVTVPNRLAPVLNSPVSTRRSPGSVNFIAGLYQDDSALTVAHAYQSVTDFHTQNPSIK